MNEKDLIESIIDESSILINNNKTKISDLYNYIFSKNLDDTAITFHKKNNEIINYTYKEYKNYIETLSQKIKSKLKDFEIGSVIGLKSDNNPNFLFTFWSILKAGFVPLLIDYKLNEENTIKLLNNASSKALIFDKKISFNTITFDELNNENNLISTDENEFQNEIIFCSSGTTGDIKLVIFNGLNLINQLNASKEMPLENLDIIYPQNIRPLKLICLLPFHHIFAFNAIFLWYTFYHSTLFFVESKNYIDAINDIKTYGITHIYHVPLFYEVVYKNFYSNLDENTKNKIINLIDKKCNFNLFDKLLIKKIKSNLFGDKIRYLITGGGNINKNVLNFFNGISYPLYNGYGLTEVGVTSVELSRNINERNKNSIGHSLFNINYKLGLKDELLIKSPTTHIKEIVNGKIINTPLDEENYFHTGDVATIVDNKVYLKGRLKEVIITSNGENVYPDDIEAYFKNVNGIKNLCAFQNNNEIVLIVEGEKSLIKDINKLNLGLPLNKRVSKFYFTNLELPLSSSLKVKRFQVKEDYLKGIFKEENIKINILKDYDQNKVNSIRNKLIPIYQKVLNVKIDIKDTDHWLNDLHSDSMTYVSLISEIEKEFNIKIDIDKYGQLITLQDFIKELIDLIK